MGLERSNAINSSYTGTASAVKILNSDENREYIALYAVLGACEIVFGSNTFNDNAITLEQGIMWEPKKVLTGELWFKGDGSKLTVLV
jgi:hypothetical protein